MHNEDSFTSPQTYKNAKPHRTVTGRIVYNRRMHRFTMKDWARIGNNVPPPDDLHEAFEAADVIITAWNKLCDFLFGWMPGYRISRFIVNKEKEILRTGLWELQRWIEPDSVLSKNIDKILGLLDGI